MLESDWFLIAVMVWFICTTASIAGCIAEPDKWSNISMCVFAFFHYNRHYSMLYDEYVDMVINVYDTNNIMLLLKM